VAPILVRDSRHVHDAPHPRRAVDVPPQGCATAAGQGHLEAIQECVATLRTQAVAATDPTDRALLAVLSLFADQLERLLNA
jgi:hypothetical protein